MTLLTEEHLLVILMIRGKFPLARSNSTSAVEAAGPNVNKPTETPPLGFSLGFILLPPITFGVCAATVQRVNGTFFPPPNKLETDLGFCCPPRNDRSLSREAVSILERVPSVPRAAQRLNMASHSGTSDSDADGSRFDTCSCPTTAELSRAVSVSLGLDPLSSPVSTVGAFPDCEPDSGSGSRGVAELGRLLLPAEDAAQVSCMDLLRSADVDAAHTVTRGSVISTYVCAESNLFVSPGAELPASPSVEQLFPGKPNLCRELPAVWCVNERAFGGRSEPQRSGSGAHSRLCKYCNCGGSRQECRCVWFNRTEAAARGAARAAVAHEYGQMESYQSAVPVGPGSYSRSIKTEPTVWMDCADGGFR